MKYPAYTRTCTKTPKVHSYDLLSMEKKKKEEEIAPPRVIQLVFQSLLSMLFY